MNPTPTSGLLERYITRQSAVDSISIDKYSYMASALTLNHIASHKVVESSKSKFLKLSSTGKPYSRERSLVGIASSVMESTICLPAEHQNSTKHRINDCLVTQTILSIHNLNHGQLYHQRPWWKTVPKLSYAPLAWVLSCLRENSLRNTQPPCLFPLPRRMNIIGRRISDIFGHCGRKWRYYSFCRTLWFVTQHYDQRIFILAVSRDFFCCNPCRRFAGSTLLLSSSMQQWRRQ